MRPTFASFYVAKGGLDAANANLSITGQNMTNAGAKGYSRQRVDLYSVGPTGWKSRYAGGPASFIGDGVSIGGVSQLRDPFLDVRYRKENSKVGDTGTQLDTLNELEGIIDESVKDGIGAQITDLVKQLQNLSLNPGDPVAESIVKTSAQMLTKIFNDAASKIDSMKSQQLEEFNAGSINTVNDLLANIAHIDSEIKQANILGNPALDLLDSRNLMIDSLSYFLPIETTTKMVNISPTISIEEISINMIGKNGEKFNLLDHDKARSFELKRDDLPGGGIGNISTPVRIKLRDADGFLLNSGDKGMVSLVGGDITDQISSGEFHAHLKMLNAKGEFDTPPSKERGVQYYEQMLNTLTSDIAKHFNEANSTNGKVDPITGLPVFDKPMFGANDGSGKVTAKNFSIAEKWNNTTGSYITNSKILTDEGITSPNASDNILYMASIFQKTFDFTTSASTPLFEGTLQGFLDQTVSTLALEIKTLDRQNKSYSGVLLDVDSQRSSVSSVNLNEEGVNLIQFNQSLSAASRFMTTIDEALDTIINKMGVVGR